MQKNYDLAEKILRYGLGITILWFGISQFINPQNWIGFLPNWVFSQAIITTTTMIYINALFETITALLLITNQFSKLISLLLSLHMLLIIFHLGYNDIAVRDFGILTGFVALIHLSDNGSIFDKKMK